PRSEIRAKIRSTTRCTFGVDAEQTSWQDSQRSLRRGERGVRGAGRGSCLAGSDAVAPTAVRPPRPPAQPQHEARMPDNRMPWFPWWHGDALQSMRNMEPLDGLAYREALDESWVCGACGVGSAEDWCRW